MARDQISTGAGGTSSADAARPDFALGSRTAAYERTGPAVKLVALFILAVAAALLFRGVLGRGMKDSPHVLKLDAAQFETSVLNAPPDQTWVLDFWAPWCGPCRQFSPEFSTTAELMSGRATFAKINVDEAPEIARAFSIQAIPSVVVVRRGSVVSRFTGGMPSKDLAAWLRANAFND